MNIAFWNVAGLKNQDTPWLAMNMAATSTVEREALSSEVRRFRTLIKGKNTGGSVEYLRQRCQIGGKFPSKGIFARSPEPHAGALGEKQSPHVGHAHRLPVRRRGNRWMDKWTRVNPYNGSSNWHISYRTCRN